jgi:hypothetical protein
MIIIDQETPIVLSEEEFEMWADSKRVFVSSTVDDMVDERAAVRREIEAIGAEPIMWELIVPVGMPPREAYTAGVKQADVYLLILKTRYGKRLPSGYSACNEEYEEARKRGIPILIWIKEGIPSNEREGHLNRWIAELQQFHSTGSYGISAELGEATRRALRRLASSESHKWAKLDDAVFLYDRFSETPRSMFNSEFSLELALKTRDPSIDSYLRDALVDQFHQRVLTIDNRTFIVKPQGFTREIHDAASSYDIQLIGEVPPAHYVTQVSSFTSHGTQYTAREVVEAMIREGLFQYDAKVLGSLHFSILPVDLTSVWSSAVERSRQAKALELVITESICRAGLLEYCAVRAVLAETAAEVAITGRLRGRGSSPGEDIRIEGFVTLL